MNRQEILEKLQEIFRDVFDDDGLLLAETMSAKDIEEWDSLHQISILAAAEDEFNIKLAISDTRKLENIGALIDLILQRKN